MTTLSKRAFLRLAAASAALAMAPGFHSGAMATTPPAAPTGQVVAGISQEPTVFNPLMPGSEVDQGIWWQVFSTLWLVDAEGNFLPDLATEVPSVENGGLSEDGLSWNIRLRDDAKWHDGTPFTANDVKFTLELINNPDFRVRNRIGHALVRDIEVVSDHEIHWTMAEPFAPYMSVLSQTFLVPEHILGAAADPNIAEFNSAPVGTGAFRWGSRSAGELIRLEANPDYHGDGPYLERVVFRYIPDQTVLYTQFRAGQLDYLGLSGIQPSFEAEARGLPGLRIVAAPMAFVEHIALNLENPIFADKAVREALYLAMNRAARIEAIYQGRPRETESYVPLGHWAYHEGLPPHRHDPEAAKTLLDAAGWLPGPDGVRVKDGLRLSFSNSTTSGAQARELSQQLLQQDWAQIGVEMRIENMPAAVIWGDFWNQSQYESVMVASNFLTGGDPDVTLRFSSGTIPAQGGSGLNTYQYRNAEVDALLAEGTREFAPERRKEIYRRIQEIIRDDLVFLPVSQSMMIEGVKEKLIGHQPNINSSSNAWNMRDWYWAE